jgi:flagellar protein FlaG
MSIQPIGTGPAVALPSAPQPPTAALASASPVSNSAIEPASRPLGVRDQRQPEQSAATLPPVAVDTDALQQAMDDVQTAIKSIANDLTFSIDEDTGRTLVKIVDRETDEVIKQIPSEEMLRIAKALDKLQGLLVKQEV